MPNQVVGVSAILVTPRNEQGAVSERGLHEHLQFLMENGLAGEERSVALTVSAGECASLTEEERRKAWNVASAVAKGRLFLIGGILHNHPDQCLKMAESAKGAGLDAVMILPPHYWRPSEETVEQFFAYVLPKIELPVILYDNMITISQVDFAPEFIARLIDTYPSIVAIKECTPHFLNLERICRAVGDRTSVINGWGEFREPYASMVGCNGFISGMVNFAPHHVFALWEAVKHQDYERAKKIREMFQPFFAVYRRLTARYGDSAQPAILKAGAEAAGLHVGPTKPPAVSLFLDERRQVEVVVRKLIGERIDP